MLKNRGFKSREINLSEVNEEQSDFDVKFVAFSVHDVHLQMKCIKKNIHCKYV